MLIETLIIASYKAKYIAFPTEAIVALIYGIMVLVSAFFLHKMKLKEKYAINKRVIAASFFAVVIGFGAVLFVSGKKDATIHWKDVYINKQNAISAIVLAINENENFTIEAMEAVYDYDKTLFLNKKLDNAFYAGTNTDMHLFFGDLFYNGTRLTAPNKAKAAIHFVAAAKDIKTLSITCENKKWAEKYLGNPGKTWVNELTFEGCDNRIQHRIFSGPSSVSKDK